MNKLEPCPTPQEISHARSVMSNWKLHYYHLLYFQTPKLTNCNGGAPFVIVRSDNGSCISLAIHAVGRPEFNFDVPVKPPGQTQYEQDAEILKKCYAILEAIREDKQKFNAAACCALAKREFCVCSLRTVCPVHGSICRGSHD